LISIQLNHTNYDYQKFSSPVVDINPKYESHTAPKLTS